MANNLLSKSFIILGLFSSNLSQIKIAQWIFTYLEDENILSDLAELK